ncbi:hypothetical protein K438DRAFT_1604819 [Mycena galopus ATCC 62051]|nr:hypothetical protein K438DRAFT_1604819 [Mycena galopus ATCC 62051]
MSDSTRPAKRQRAENASITRSKIWHKDGSVVLQAQNIQFRVHWGVLSLHSSFFRDMQDLPQPPQESDNVDGCPVIEVSDSAVDVEYLLNALYNPLFSSEKVLDFGVLASLVRLGRKYAFTNLLNTAVELLASENPRDFETYRILAGSDYDLPGTHSFSRISNYPGVYFDIITLARENDLFAILPCAYYRAITLGYDQVIIDVLFDSLRRNDGTYATLSPVDQRRCVLGRAKLLKAQFAPSYTFGSLRADSKCINDRKCTIRKKDLLRDLLLTGQVWALGMLPRVTSECSNCDLEFRQAMAAGRQKIWEELPSFFDLPPWSELKNEP